MSSVEGSLPVRCGGEAEQQPERVAVGGDRVRAGVAFADQPVGEERLQRRGERAHRARLQVTLEALAGERQQLRRGLQVPVRVIRDRRARGRSTARGSPGPTSCAGAVGVEQRVDREAVAQVVRSAGGTPPSAA